MTHLTGKRTGWAWCIAAMTILSLSQSALAQRDRNPFPNRSTNSPEVEDLLRNLIESELNRRDSRPTTPARSPLRQPDASIRSSEWTEVSRSVTNFAREADRLTTALSADSRVVPGLRQYISDVLKVRARSSLLAQKVNGNQNLREVVTDFQALDQSWRVTAFQLSQTRGLSRAATNSLQLMNDDMKKLGQILRTTPQLNRNELLQETASMATGLHHLLDDIQLELGRTAETQNLLHEGSQIEQQIRYLSKSISDRYEYDYIVQEYRRYEQMWTKFATRLWNTENRYIERGLRRIQANDSAIRKLLWLEDKINTQELLHATTVLTRDVEQFFMRAPLKLLIELPRGDEVIPSADQFYGVCQHFIDVVQRGEDMEELVDSYGYIDDAWREFHAIFRPMKSTSAHQVLEQIEESMENLRSLLHISVGFDRNAATELAASLEHLSEHLSLDCRRWLTRSRDPNRDTAMRDVETFANAANSLHRSMIAQTDVQSLQRQVIQLNTQWRRVSSHLDRCRTEERSHLQRLSAQISPILVDLQTLVVK